MSVAPQITNEIDPLELVVVSPPGEEFLYMLPENLEPYSRQADGSICENPDYLLFDDLVLLSAMQQEHRQLVDVISAVTGNRGCVTFRRLLAATLSDDEAAETIVDDVLALEVELYPKSDLDLARSRAVMLELDATSLADALITGHEPNGGRRLLRWPVPNTLFARDLAATIGDCLILTYAADPARRRDMLLMRGIVRHHRLLRDLPRIDIADDVPVRQPGQPAATIEGGDIQVLSNDVVLIGVSIRTTMQAVERLAPRLLERGFKSVLACEMPRRRAAMHIDTLFTMIDREHCLIYPPLFQDPDALKIQVHRFYPGGRKLLGSCLLSALQQCGIALSPIRCGGTDPVSQAREQWSDGANAFALSPGVVICYGRNQKTLRELNQYGYQIVEPSAFVQNALFYMTHAEQRVAVALMGHELVRGRGGPRCLTLPLRRSAVPWKERV